MREETFDAIVVGAGSSGGTVAARLSEDPWRRVLLLEAGPDFPDERADPPEFFVGGALHGEAGAGSGPSPQLDWNYLSECLPGGRRIRLKRGRMVGGSSMANGCVAVRGRPEDFERWREAGAVGWGWSEVVPFYEAVEREIPIMRYPPEVWLPFQRAFVESCQEIGFRYSDDLNEPDAWDGVVGPWPRNRRNEIRQGSLVTYIRGARERPNLTISDFALVDRVLLADGRATGVAYLDRRGGRREVHADRIVVCAGAYGSAPILLRSGIGPAEQLSRLGIDALVDLPVGLGLMEHPSYAFELEVSRPAARGGWPSLAVAARGEGWWGIPMSFDAERGRVSLIFCLALVDGPLGTICLDSADPAVPPAIDHGYEQVTRDGSFGRVWADFQRLLETEALRAIDARDAQGDLPFGDRLRAGVATGTHPAGGCGIGKVVDSNLEVYGVGGLTVADASVFPRHVTNNPNLTCHMVGEYAAALLRGTTALPDPELAAR